MRLEYFGLTANRNAKSIIENSVQSEQTYYRWKKEYNTVRPHSSLGYRAPEAVQPRSDCYATQSDQG